MKILKQTRGIASNRLTKIDPNKIITDGETLHSHPNLNLLNSITVKNRYLKIADEPLETYLIAEEW